MDESQLITRKKLEQLEIYTSTFVHNDDYCTQYHSRELNRFGPIVSGSISFDLIMNFDNDVFHVWIFFSLQFIKHETYDNTNWTITSVFLVLRYCSTYLECARLGLIFTSSLSIEKSSLEEKENITNVNSKR